MYMISPRIFNKYILVLLIYANCFLIETYIFTLIEGTTLTDAKPIIFALGLAPTKEKYDPESPDEYFRYNL